MLLRACLRLPFCFDERLSCSSAPPNVPVSYKVLRLFGQLRENGISELLFFVKPGEAVEHARRFVPGWEDWTHSWRVSHAAQCQAKQARARRSAGCSAGCSAGLPAYLPARPPQTASGAQGDHDDHDLARQMQIRPHLFLCIKHLVRRRSRQCSVACLDSCRRGDSKPICKCAVAPRDCCLLLLVCWLCSRRYCAFRI